MHFAIARTFNTKIVLLVFHADIYMLARSTSKTVVLKLFY